MRLASVSDILPALGLQDLPDYVAAVTQALEDATLLLENDLRTDFDQTYQTDTFLPNPFEPLTKLKLRKGFVYSGPQSGTNMLIAAPVVLYAVSQSAFILGETIDISSACSIQLEKGVVSIDGSQDLFLGGFPDGYEGLPYSMLQVSYTAGLAVSDADEELYDPILTPSWLQQIAKIKARILMWNHPALEVSKSVADIKELKCMYNSVISRKSRYNPDCILARF